MAPKRKFDNAAATTTAPASQKAKSADATPSAASSSSGTTSSAAAADLQKLKDTQIKREEFRELFVYVLSFMRQHLEMKKTLKTIVLNPLHEKDDDDENVDENYVTKLLALTPYVKLSGAAHQFESNNVASMYHKTEHIVSDDNDPIPVTVFSTRLNISATFCSDDKKTKKPICLTSDDGCSVVLNSENPVGFQFMIPPSFYMVHIPGTRSKRKVWAELWEPVPLRWMYTCRIFGKAICRFQLSFAKEFEVFMSGFVGRIITELAVESKHPSVVEMSNDLANIIEGYAFDTKKLFATLHDWEKTVDDDDDDDDDDDE